MRKKKSLSLVDPEQACSEREPCGFLVDRRPDLYAGLEEV